MFRHFYAVVAVLGVTGSLMAAAAPANAAQLPYQQNWAVLNGWNRSSSPVIADIDNDGQNEVVFGAQDGKLRAYEADGTLKWAVNAVPGVGPGCNAQSSPSSIDSSPAVADIDEDGKMEVIVGVGSAWHSGQNGSVISFDGATGAIEWRTNDSRDTHNIWTGSLIKDGWCEATFATPAIGDVDGDGHLDVVFGSWDFFIWAVDRFGQPLPGFPVNNDDTVWSSPALFDVDGDGAVEIFIGGDSSPGGYFDHLGGVFRALKWQNNQVVELWNRTANEVIMGSAAIGDINGDGRAEAVVSTGEYWYLTCGQGSPQCSPGDGSDRNKLFAFHLDDGSTVAGFPVSANGTIRASPALGDLDGDGLPEVVVGSHDTYVRAWHGDGSLMWAKQTTHGAAHLGASPISGHPIIADLDGDGDQDVAVGSHTGLALLDGRTGVSLESGAWQYRMGAGYSYETAPAVGVLGGQRKIVFTGFDTPGNRTRVAAFALPSSSAIDAWPMFRQNAARTGSALTGLCQLTGAKGTFCDVAPGSYYELGVEWMVRAGITTGLSATAFGPNLTLTRGQMITFMWRQAGEPGGYAAPGFSDVSSWDFFAGAVAWAKAEGISSGTSDTTFSPQQPVSRGQMVTLLWRRAGSKRGLPNPGFSDVPAGWYYSDAIAWAKHTGVSNGMTATTFAPNQPVTRGQVAALLWREAGRP